MLGGLYLGDGHADAAAIGGIGMLLAWAGARAFAPLATSSSPRIRARDGTGPMPGIDEVSARPSDPTGRTRHVLVYSGLSAVAGAVAALMGAGHVDSADIAAFAVFGAALGAFTPRPGRCGSA